MDILIGTSGYSYADWKGHFYPRGLKQGEMLSFYAQYFRAVEINSTYYRPPEPANMTQMARSVPDHFEFVLKAHQDMTHGDRFQPEVFAQFRSALTPLRDAGKLGGVLAQFPWSFKCTPESRQYLTTFRSELPEVPLAVEFRNSEWVGEETFRQLRTLGIAFCCVDEPRLKGLMPPVAAATSSLGYVRFHGRNAKSWWQHEHAWQRYDYLYSREELEEWAPKVQEIAAETEKTYVFYNNHYQGQAGQNARMMADLLNLTYPLPFPQAPQETLDLEKAESRG
jgi:uncharacterized protein YecE (DUF72 family)